VTKKPGNHSILFSVEGAYFLFTEGLSGTQVPSILWATVSTHDFQGGHTEPRS
jgi:hypothetical protein